MLVQIIKIDVGSYFDTFSELKLMNNIDLYFALDLIKNIC